MDIAKRVLGNLFLVYAVTAFRRGGAWHYVAATEVYGQTHLYAPPDYQPTILSERPGGVMGMVSLGADGSCLLAIQQAYPIYNFGQSQVSEFRPGPDRSQPWDAKIICELPFLHRIGVVPIRGEPTLIAATLAGGKSRQEDWSQPGAVYAGRLSQDLSSEMSPILTGISRNHGFNFVVFGNRPHLLVSGREGLFSLPIPGCPGEPWISHQWLDTDVSDMAVFDLDGDGRDELITIEPFHGNQVGIYRQEDSGWRKVEALPCDFGHVVWAGLLGGIRSLLIGSRAGKKDLVIYQYADGTCRPSNRIVLDEGTGPTNAVVIHEPDHELILCSNHAAGEVALYTLRA